MKLMKKEAGEPKKYLLPDAMVYGQYKLSVVERAITFAVGFVIGYVAGDAFYGIKIVSIIAGIVIGLACGPKYRSMRIDKQKAAIKNQFRSFLESVSFSLSAGRTVIQAIESSRDDLLMQYTEKDYMVKEVENIVLSLNNNEKIENLLYDLADRSECDDIKSFADVFSTCYEKGGNIQKVILSTYNLINDKMEVGLEIDTIMASSRMEQNMMMVMPVAFVIILNSMGGDMTGRGTPVGYLATTIALVMFGLAYIVGKKVMNIKM